MGRFAQPDGGRDDDGKGMLARHPNLVYWANYQPKYGFECLGNLDLWRLSRPFRRVGDICF